MPRTRKPVGRRDNGEGSIREKPNGRFEGRIRLGDAQRSVSGTTKDEVRAKLDKLVREHAQGIDAAAGREPLRTYLVRWIETADLDPNTRRGYLSYARKRIVPALGDFRLDKLAVRDVRAFLVTLRQTKLAPASIRQIHAILRAALNDAVRAELLPRNVAALVRPPKVRRAPPPVITPVGARAILTALRGDRLEALYAVALALGLRQGEALGLLWECMNLDAGTLTVCRQLQRLSRAWLLKDLPKSDSGFRTVTIPSPLIAVLQRHRAAQVEECAGWRDPYPAPLVFTSALGQPLHAKYVTSHFQKRILPKAQLGHLRFHDLRHACASLLLAQGVDMRTIMQILGHSQIGVTMNTYAHVLPALERAAADIMGHVLYASAEDQDAPNEE